jgi:tetratricopeptide (TPR) repeat protein
VKKKTAAVYTFLIISTLFSCKTVDSVNGMIYDFSNRPIQDYTVNLNEKYVATTDINGRFTINKVKMGQYSIKGVKVGFETYKSKITIDARNQIVYIRVPSQTQLLELADEALTKNRLDDAEAYVKRAYDAGILTTEVLFYYATVKFRQNDYDEAIEYLEKAKQIGSKDAYVDKFLGDLIRIKENEE